MKNLIQEHLVSAAKRLALELHTMFVSIPSQVCVCGKPVVFLPPNDTFKCSRCGARWRLLVRVEKIEDKKSTQK